jgi:hypothetical protein
MSLIGFGEKMETATSLPGWLWYLATPSTAPPAEGAGKRPLRSQKLQKRPLTVTEG